MRRETRYDILPVTDGWILRCAANGRVILRSDKGELHAAFVRRCSMYTDHLRSVKEAGNDC